MNDQRILDGINSPQDLKKLPREQLEQLCAEIRQELISTTSRTGGHLASNLGTVELTVAIHRVFDCPQDQIVWDVGHQAYTHKLLTGRRERFSTLRQEGGLSGFPKRKESPYDAYLAGHSSTSISAAFGLVRAKRLQGDDHHVLAVIGDGSFTSGLAYEGANNAGRTGDNLIVIFNDNKMSISKNNVGPSRYLSQLRARPGYFKLKDTVSQVFDHVPLVGKPINHALQFLKGTMKEALYSSNWFEAMGYVYMGPVDGHDLDALCSVLTRARELHRPVFIYVETQKGKGYRFAEENPGEFHGTPGFDIETGIPKSSGGTNFSEQFGRYLTQLANQDPKICAVTAAMKYGTGLNYFSKELKSSGRFYDVGIAESHAVTFCGGLAAGGMLPVFAVYSSFLQRSYDQVLHDLSIEPMHVVLAVDRAGLVGNDGETHQGVFDVAMLSTVPGMVIYSPATYAELRRDLYRACYEETGPCCVRYPRGGEISLLPGQMEARGDWSLWQKNADAAGCIVTYGRLTQQVLEAAQLLEEQGEPVSVLKLERAFPLPQDAVDWLKQKKKILFAEEGIEAGGLGEAMAAALLEAGYTGSYHIQAIRNRFIPQSSAARAFFLAGLDGESIARRWQNS